MDRNVFPAIGAIGLFTARGGGGGVYCPPPSANLSSAPGDAALGQYLRMGHAYTLTAFGRGADALPGTHLHARPSALSDN